MGLCVLLSAQKDKRGQLTVLSCSLLLQTQGGLKGFLPFSQVYSKEGGM